MRNSTLWRSGMLSLLLFGLAFSTTYAQEKMLTGKVTSAEEGALPGVNVILEGSGQGTVTGVDGTFSISVPGSESVLVFSSIGYITESIKVGNQSAINLVLKPDITSLKEIVVTGYASQQKQDLTGSVDVIKSEELNAMPQGNVVNQMQGRASGVVVTQDSRPGETARIRIRGYGSFQDNNPLYIVDGVPTTDISNLNPNDVESLSVLKDAGAASIYGARASNGVIVVTTKQGKKGMAVGFGMYYGSQNPGKGPENLLNTQEYADLTFKVYDNEGISVDNPIYGSYDPANPTEPTFPAWAANTNWWDEATNNAPIQNYDLSLSGGNDVSKFFSGIGYFKQDGVTLNNFYERFNARFNSSFNIKDRVTIGENVTVTYTERNEINNQDENTPLISTYRLQSITPVIMDQDVNGQNYNFKVGDWGGTGLASGTGNALNYVAERTRQGDNLGQNLRLLGNVFADVKIIDGLNFKTLFGGSYGQWYWTNWSGSTYENAENRATASYQEGSGYGTDWNWVNTFTYNKTFGESTILAVLGYEAVKTGIGRGVDAQRAGYFSEAFSYRTVSNGASITAANSYFNTPRSLQSVFLRADYNLKEKYYLSATVRRDGASVFGEDYRYGTFPSVSAAWRITEESFLAGGTFLTDFKLRGSWGQMGNQNPVNPANQYYLYGGSTGSSFYDLQGTSNSSLQGFRPTRIGNADTKWETVTTSDIGFDASLFDNAFEIVFDWYLRNSTELLFNPELPGTAGAADAPFVNIAEMKNTGFDMQFIYQRMWNDFTFQANAQLTTVSNEIVSLAEGYDYFDSGDSRIGSFSRNQVGGSMAQFYGYNVIGLFSTSDFTLEDDEYIPVSGVAVQDGGEPGFLRYEDVDGDGEITPDDRKFIGSPIADFTYGLNLDFGWKNFDFSAFFYGQQGNEIFNYNKWWYDFWPSFQGQKSTDLLYNSWTTTNQDASVPKASNKSNFSTNTQATSYYVEDGSYLRLKQISLGYTFPKTIFGGVFTNARVYVQGVNLFTATGYSGMDPELAVAGASSGDVNFGVDRGNVPAVKQYIVGINLGF